MRKDKGREPEDPVLTEILTKDSRYMEAKVRYDAEMLISFAPTQKTSERKTTDILKSVETVGLREQVAL